MIWGFSSKEIIETNDVDLLQTDLNASISWSAENNMLLHVDKFEYLRHSTGSSKLLQELPFSSQFFEYITEEGIYITPTHMVRDLGINVVPELQWSPHINIIPYLTLFGLTKFAKFLRSPNLC